MNFASFSVASATVSLHFFCKISSSALVGSIHASFVRIVRTHFALDRLAALNAETYDFTLQAAQQSTTPLTICTVAELVQDIPRDVHASRLNNRRWLFFQVSKMKVTSRQCIHFRYRVLHSNWGPCATIVSCSTPPR